MDNGSSTWINVDNLAEDKPGEIRAAIESLPNE